MIEGTVEAIIARCLLEPAFLDGLRADTVTALAAYGLDEDARRQVAGGDFEKIRRFAGFIAKVQHNHLWESFPATRHLLRFYQIEGDVFTAFRPLQMEHAASENRDERIRIFVAFLDKFVSGRAASGLDYPGLAELLRHESNIWELGLRKLNPARGPALPPAGLSSISWPRFKQLVPRRTGPFRISAYATDPVDIQRRVKQRSFDRRLASAHRIILLYWIDGPGPAMRLLQLDDVSGLILSRVNDQRSVRAVIDHARRDSLIDVPPLAFRQVFEEAARIGLLSIGNRSDDARDLG